MGRHHTKRIRVQLDLTFEFDSDQAARNAYGLNWPVVLLNGLMEAGRIDTDLGKGVTPLGGNVNVRYPMKKKDD